jgi:hypothetical protein
MNFVTIGHTTINLNQITAVLTTGNGEVIIKMSNKDICTFQNCNYDKVLTKLAILEERVRSNSNIEKAKKDVVRALASRSRSINNRTRPAG